MQLVVTSASYALNLWWLLQCGLDAIAVDVGAASAAMVPPSGTGAGRALASLPIDCHPDLLDQSIT
jgi:hypothetical protein